MRTMVVSFLILVLVACAGGPSRLHLKQHHIDLITVQNFGICKGYGCRHYLKTGLTSDEWQQVVDIFAAPQQDAAQEDAAQEDAAQEDAAQEDAVQERRAIKKAIGLFERFIGPKTGTETDRAGAQIINFSTRGQMDCVDEAFNSTTYLYLLRKAGLIRHHSLGETLRRGNYFDRWPHNTATIHEIKNLQGHYVVDSWFHANGQEPEIVAAALWSGGWSPSKK